MASWFESSHSVRIIVAYKIYIYPSSYYYKTTHTLYISKHLVFNLCFFNNINDWVIHLTIKVHSVVVYI